MSDKWTAGRHPRPERSPGRGHRRQQRPRPGHGARRWPRTGARCVLACRNADKGGDGARGDRGEVPGRRRRVVRARPRRPRLGARLRRRVSASARRLDLLINNAGVMALPRRDDRRRLRDPVRHQPPRPLRAHRPAARRRCWPRRRRGWSRCAAPPTGSGRINFDDLHGESAATAAGAPTARRSSPTCSSRSSCERRLRAAGSTVLSRRRPPRLRRHQPPVRRGRRCSIGRSWRSRNRLLAQSAEMGALPTLYAATQPGLDGGTYVGPDGFEEQRGHPQRRWSRRAALDQTVAAQLWTVSEEPTGVHFDLPTPVAPD